MSKCNWLRIELRVEQLKKFYRTFQREVIILAGQKRMTI